MDTEVILGAFKFRDMEIPASINGGGEQSLIVKKLVGGSRVIDAMGPDDDDISWGGLIQGSDSIDRAMQLDGMRIAGQPVLFTYFNLRYYVLVKSFKFNIERYYQITYSLTLTVLKDFNQPAGLLSLLGISDAIINDFTIANTIAGLINDPTLNAAMGTLNTAISSVSSFSNAPVATVNSVLGPLSTAQSTVSSLIAATRARLFT